MKLGNGFESQRRTCLLLLGVTFLLSKLFLTFAINVDKEEVIGSLRSSIHKKIKTQQADTDDIICENVFRVSIEPEPKTNGHNFDDSELRCYTSGQDESGQKTKLMYTIGGGGVTKMQSDSLISNPDNIAMVIKKGSGFINENDATITLSHNPDIEIHEQHSESEIDEEHSNHRRLATTTTFPSSYEGTKTVLAIRVIGANPGEEPTQEANIISRRIFGGSNDDLNLKSGYAACSGNSLNITKATGNNIVDGVLEVTLDISTTGQSGNFLENKIAIAAKDRIGTSTELENLYDFVMMCLPSGTAVNTAYAYLGWKRSVYNNNWCLYPSATMHEIGHNIGLYHSNENNILYEDQSCMMGFSYVSDHETPQMCFNGAKSWVLGWYNDKSRSIDLDPASQESWTGRLVGVTDYLDAVADRDNIVIELITGIHSDVNVQNYYILYNRAAGINSDVLEFGDQVTITKGAYSATSNLKEVDESDHLAHLSPGQAYSIVNFKGTSSTLTIKYCGLFASSPIYAKVSIFFGSNDQCNAPPTPPSPVTTPTSAPSLAPSVRSSSPPGPPVSNCPSGKFQLVLQVKTDRYPGESSWNIFDDNDVSVAQNGFLSRDTFYEHDFCFTDGCYRFVMEDSWGDGFCCAYGNGFYAGYLYGNFNGPPTFSGADFGEIATERFCGSSSPTPRITESPSSAPSQGSIKCSANNFNVEVNLRTDRYPGETRFELYDPNKNKAMDEKQFSAHTDHTYNECFPQGCYVFKIYDSWGDGICCGYGDGSVNVKVEGTTVVEAAKFGSVLTHRFCGCPAGQTYFELKLTPDMYPQETSWELKDASSAIVMSGSSQGTSGCISDTSCYSFFIYDTYADGICCDFGQGSFTVLYDNVVVATGGVFQSIFSTSFGATNCASAASLAGSSTVIIDQSYEKIKITSAEDDEEKGIFQTLKEIIIELVEQIINAIKKLF